MLSETEHDAMTGTVHWLEAVLLLRMTFLHEINMLFVFVVVATNFPQLRMEDIGSDYFLIASDLIL